MLLLVTVIWVNPQDKSQNSSNLKIPALTFLRAALESTDPSVWQKHLPVLSPAVFATVGERYYKVTAQGLRVAERLIFVIRPSTQSQISGSSSVRLHAWIQAFCHLAASHLILCHLHVRRLLLLANYARVCCSWHKCCRLCWSFALLLCKHCDQKHP